MNRDKVSNIFYTIVVPLIEAVSFAFLILFLVSDKVYPAIASMMVIIACCSYILVTPLIIKRRLRWHEIIEVVLSGTSTVTFIIIFVCGSPEEYREVLGSISGSLMGGLFTLFGVGLTIKYNRLSKEEDDKQKAKPHVFPIAWDTYKNIYQIEDRNISIERWVSNLERAKEDEEGYALENIYLANSDLAMCVYEGIIINDHVLYFDNGVVLLRGSNVCINHNISFKLKEEIISISLILADVLDHHYRAEMEFRLQKSGFKTYIEIISVYKTIDLEEKYFVPCGTDIIKES